MGSVVAAVAVWLGASTATAAAIGVAVNIAVAAYSTYSSVKAASDQKKAAKRAQMESQQRNAYRNFRQPLTPRRIIYGRARVAGPLLFAHNRGTNEAHLVVGIAGHEVDGFETFHILKDDLPVQTDPELPFLGRVTGKYRNSVMLWPFRGTDDQDIGFRMRNVTDIRPGGNGANISLDFITTNDRFRGIAALYIVTKNFGVNFEGQSPDFAATLRGHRVHDPRTGLTEWSENPALCAAHYLITYMGFPPESIDQDMLAASADVCDELVPISAGGSERRYTCNGVLGAESDHDENLRALAESMAGAIRYASGQWLIEAGAPKIETPIPFTEAMVLGGYEVEIERPDRSLPNAVRGNFIDPADWQATSFPAHEDAAAIAAEGGTHWLDVELPLTTSHSMAQRIARIYLGRSRARRTLSLEFDLRGLLARPGSLISYTAPDVGFAGEVFEVDGFALSQSSSDQGATLTVRLDLVDYDPSIYAWTVADERPMVRGDVAIDAIRSKFFENATCEERNVTTAGEAFQADYLFTAGVPSSAWKSLESIRFRVEVDLTTSYVDANSIEHELTETHIIESVESYDFLQSSLAGKAYTVAGEIPYPVETAGGTPASGELTITTQPAAGDTVTIGPRTITWIDAGTPGADQVLLDTVLPEPIRHFASADNLVAMLAAADPLVTAERIGEVITITARQPGPGGNAIALAATGTAITAATPTLEGGAATLAATGEITFTAAPADGDTLTLAGRTLTWIAEGPAGPDQLVIDDELDPTVTHGYHAQRARLFFQDHPDVALAGQWNVLTLTARVLGEDGNSLPLSATGTAITVSGTHLSGGSGGALTPHTYESHTVRGASIEGIYSDATTTGIENAILL